MLYHFGIELELHFYTDLPPVIVYGKNVELCGLGIASPTIELVHCMHEDIAERFVVVNNSRTQN